MRNYIAPGQSVDLTVTEAAFGEDGAVVGQGYVVGAIFGVAANTAAVGETVTLHLTGIYEFSVGMLMGSIGTAAYWSNTNKSVDIIPSGAGAGTYRIGTYVGAGSGGSKAQVRLDGVGVTAVPAEDEGESGGGA
jgi:predicted RecA/RadA family phage recombinase